MMTTGRNVGSRHRNFVLYRPKGVPKVRPSCQRTGRRNEATEPRLCSGTKKHEVLQWRSHISALLTFGQPVAPTDTLATLSGILLSVSRVAFGC
jgi:hypothetical protein